MYKMAPENTLSTFFESASSIMPGGKEQQDAICSAVSLKEMWAAQISSENAQSESIAKHDSFLLEMLRLQVVNHQVEKDKQSILDVLSLAVKSGS